MDEAARLSPLSAVLGQTSSLEVLLSALDAGSRSPSSGASTSASPASLQASPESEAQTPPQQASSPVAFGRNMNHLQVPTALHIDTSDTRYAPTMSSGSPSTRRPPLAKPPKAKAASPNAQPFKGLLRLPSPAAASVAAQELRRTPSPLGVHYNGSSGRVSASSPMRLGSRSPSPHAPSPQLAASIAKVEEIVRRHSPTAASGSAST